MAIRTRSGPTPVITATDAGRGISDFLSANVGSTSNIYYLNAPLDGVTDCLPMIQAAINTGRPVYFPSPNGGPVTYMISSALVLPSNAILIGADRSLITIKLMARANTDIIVGANAYGLIGTNSNAGANNIYIGNLTLDGNATNQTMTGSGRDACNGITIYGQHATIERVLVQNVVGHGLRTEWTGNLGLTTGVESIYSDVHFVNINRRAVWNNGPSDSSFKDVVWQDAGQEADNTYVGFYQDTAGSFRGFNLHGYHSFGNTTRVAFQISTNGGSQIIAAHFEGGRGQVQTRSGVCDIFSACDIYAPFGSANSAQIQLLGDGTIFDGCAISGYTLAQAAAQGAGSTASVFAIQFGNVSTPSANNQFNACYFTEFAQLSPFNFLNDGGGNIISGLGYASDTGGAVTYTGTLNSTTRFTYFQNGSTSWSFGTPLTSNSTAATASSITYTGSPFAYTASVRGVYTLFAGTISAITLKRGATTASLNTTVSTIDVAAGDIVTVTYSVAPTSTFFPS